MWVRVTRLRGSQEQVDRVADQFAEDVAPALRSMQGNLGAVLLVDRSNRSVTTISYWESREALQASEEAASTIRSDTIRSMGVALSDVERYELALVEWQQPLQAKNCARVNTLNGSAEFS